MIQTHVAGLAKLRPTNIFKTLTRLWPATMLIPFRALIKGSKAIYFRHPFATLSGEIRVGCYAEIGAHVYINAGQDGVDIGAYSQINPLTSIVGNVRLGNRVLIAPGCSIAAGGHQFGKGMQPRFSGGSKPEYIVIEDDVWIGAGTTIVGSVTIGRGSVIAAGITVDRNIPAETLVRRGTSNFVSESLR
jgi:acetyltransferase-like isoleucine patch superfamily enzyme